MLGQVTTDYIPMVAIDPPTGES